MTNECFDSSYSETCDRLKKEIKRFKIAKACGWVEEYIHGNGIDGILWVDPEKARSFLYPPDYFNDLNAMFEAEKILNYSNVSLYLSLLRTLKHSTEWQGQATHTTAAQRAEAFGLTLGLWTN